MLISELLLVALIIREMFSALSSFTLLPSTKSSEASTKRTPLLLRLKTIIEVAIVIPANNLAGKAITHSIKPFSMK